MKCRLCFSRTEEIFETLVLNKYKVKYYKCPNCEFIQTEEPYWLEEAYTSAISDLDTGILLRNNKLAKQLTTILLYLSDQADNLKILDYGGGYGILVRLMRDIGFDFYWYDRYCKNLFAKGFEKKEIDYPIVTAFELLEHFPRPIEEVRNIIEQTNCNNLIFSTLLYGGQPPLKDWWYYDFEEGKHVSFYNYTTLEYIAKHFGYHFYSDYVDFHIFSKEPLNESKIRRYLKYSNIYFIKNKKKFSSMTFSDHLYVKKLIS